MAKRKISIWRYVLVVAILLFIPMSYYAYQICFTPNIQVQKKATYLYIPTGATFQTVMDSLNKMKALEDPLSFMFMTKLMGYRDKVKPGRYRLDSSTTNLKVIRMLRSGNQEPLNLTFNSVRTRADLVSKLQGKFEFKADTLLTLLNSPEVAKKFGFDTSSIMVMFIPNTYKVHWNTSAIGFMDRMYKEYNSFWDKDRQAQAASIGLSPVEVSILASIVEGETYQTSEWKRIAGVYVNRYKSGELLQADPTVKFALQDFALKRILKEHLKVNSPYNTYLNKGLPPGPINLPSPEALKAVLNYEKHKYLFFCASTINPGYHEFAETYSEHLKIAKRYHQKLNGRP